MSRATRKSRKFNGHRLDENGYPILTKREVKRIAESMIPQEFRPYYVGCEVDVENGAYPLSAWNSEIYMDFKAPVTGYVDDARYVHCSLEDLEASLKDLCIDEDSVGSDDYAEWDEENDGKKAVRIRDEYPILNGWEKVVFVDGFEIPA